MNFAKIIQKSFSNVKKDMVDLKLLLIEMLSNIVKNQALLNARLKRIEQRLNLERTDEIKVTMS